MGVSPQDENVEEEQSPHHEDGDDPDVSMNVQIRASKGIVRRSRPRRYATYHRLTGAV